MIWTFKNDEGINFLPVFVLTRWKEKTDTSAFSISISHYLMMLKTVLLKMKLFLKLIIFLKATRVGF
ncbi:hypothetical protein NMY3_02694 [Candidatus Nitrosocosmicus oleophilus]|uniref:Uncharacterized protein n=1 Tax=Candidatus Nitrosocosmicus oleophilus TaxID=1353260 RepID=A0A654LZA5_9ARCH|nr:hypothetical protein NMY3_02694 [Candidatus Nitrosocosmicus oleophilus]